MKITESTIRQIAPTAPKDAAKFVQPLNDAMAKYAIDTLPRAAMFLAQIMHESGALRYMAELASGAAYEGRKDLGNTQPGDGKRYKGRGVIQITGRANYAALSKALGQDFVNASVMLEQLPWAVLSAGWFWDTHNLNALADKGDFIGITKKINGGTNGLSDRQAYYSRAAKALQPLFV